MKRIHPDRGNRKDLVIWTQARIRFATNIDPDPQCNATNRHHLDEWVKYLGLAICGEWINKTYPNTAPYKDPYTDPWQLGNLGQISS